MSRSWEIEQIVEKLNDISSRGFIGVIESDHRTDDGVVGQVLEKLFGIRENNLCVGDLGKFELKSARVKSSTITLCHKKPNRGLTPLELFERFSYVKPSKRDPSVIKRKLFTTVTGKKPNSLGLRLVGLKNHRFELHYENEQLCEWDISEQISKIDSVIMVFATTEGATNSRSEKFHYNEAFLLKDILDIGTLISSGIVVLDLCIDQVLGGKKAPHDRGPHIRVPKSKLFKAYKTVIPLLAKKTQKTRRKK